jgi:hypothetical protein
MTWETPEIHGMKFEATMLRTPCICACSASAGAGAGSG